MDVEHRRKALVCAQDVTKLKEAEEALHGTVRELESALAEKTVLLKEIHHRVKNNLAVISSLLALKADATASCEAKLVLEDSQRRVRSIALIHEHLYGSDRSIASTLGIRPAPGKGTVLELRDRTGTLQ